MFDLKDINTLESDEDASPIELALALQRAINSGLWSLQGSYGRSMADAIEEGSAMLGNVEERDYYGNRIPSRTQVQPGTKGSREYVVARHGEDWAARLDLA